MLKSTLLFATVILTSIPSAFAAPRISLQTVSTPYGTFSCVQRSKNKLYSMNATEIQVYSDAVWAILDNSRILVWCRGQEAVINVASNDINPIVLKDEIKSAF